MNDLVSITITTKNEELNIENCLKSIKFQSYKNIEIIVVDNNSTDSTKMIASKYTDKVFDYGPERSAQRNHGMLKKSIGNYLMFLDADMILSPFLIEDSLNFMKYNNFQALHIPEIILGKSYLSKVRRFERSFYNGTVIDGARIFHKDLFHKINGFNEKISGPEDWDLDKEIKKITTIGLLDSKLLKPVIEWEKEFNTFLISKEINNYNSFGSVIFHNESEFNLLKYLSKKSYYAQSMKDYISKWGVNDPDIKKQLGFMYRYFLVFFENGKYINLIKNPILTTGMYFLRFLVGLMYLKKKIL